MRVPGSHFSSENTVIGKLNKYLVSWTITRNIEVFFLCRSLLGMCTPKVVLRKISDGLYCIYKQYNLELYLYICPLIFRQQSLFLKTLLQRKCIFCVWWGQTGLGHYQQCSWLCSGATLAHAQRIICHKGCQRRMRISHMQSVSSIYISRASEVGK